MNRRQTTSERKPLSYITARYDRVARVYTALEPLFLILPRLRRAGVDALELTAGDTVLEIGAGTGRNLRYLIDAVGPSGKVIALDASAGMLAEARRLVRRRGWNNVDLLQQDAAQLQVDQPLDGVLFSLSYSVLPHPRPALTRAWQLMKPSARLVVMDAGLSYTPLRRLLEPVARMLIKLGPGDPHSRPVEDLAVYGTVQVERFLLGIYYVCTVQKTRL